MNKKTNKKGNRLLLIILAVGMIPFIIIGSISWLSSKKALESSAISNLEALRDSRKVTIEQYFKSAEKNVNSLKNSVDSIRKEFFENMKNHKLDKVKKTDSYLNSISSELKKVSSQRSIIDSMKKFPTYFNEYALKNSSKPMSDMKRHLTSYYTNKFAINYKDITGNRTDVTKYINSLSNNSIALQYDYISNNPHDLGSKDNLESNGNMSNYDKLHKSIHNQLTTTLKENNFYDIFLVDIDDGNIVYSVFKEIDYSTSLKTGSFSNTGIGEVYNKALSSNKGDISIVDYKVYYPSYDAPAGFIATPIYDEDVKVGILIFQMPIETLTNIVSGTNLGETSEAIMIGNDFKFRTSSSILETHTVENSFRRDDIVYDTKEIITLFDNNKDVFKLCKDYRGKLSYNMFTVYKFLDLKWALVIKIDIDNSIVSINNKDNFYNKFNKNYGFYDTFLIESNGHCFFTVERESDYNTNLLNGKYKDSGLGEVVKDVLKYKNLSFSDFKPYEPSNYDPASFIASPIFNEKGDIELIVAVQLSLDQINEVMTDSSGMMNTAETVLVGPDYLMRSDSIKSPETHSVINSFKNPNKGKVDTNATRSVHDRGESGVVFTKDYKKDDTIIAYTPLKVFGDVTYCLNAKVDCKEAFSSIDNMTILIIVIGIAGLTIILYLALKLEKPIKEVIYSLSNVTTNVFNSSNNVSLSSKNVASGASEQAASLEEVSSALEELAAQTQKNAESSRNADVLSKEASDIASDGKKQVFEVSNIVNNKLSELTTSISSIRSSTEQTADIIKTIDDIAFQTNILSLNAAVEAARAGAAGKGFAVVAEAVRGLAQRSSEAAKNTAALIKEAQTNTEKGVLVSNEVEAVLKKSVQDDITTIFTKTVNATNKVTELMEEIANSSEEQAKGIEQINESVSQMEDVTQNNSSNADKSANSSSELNKQAETLKSHVETLTSIVISSKKNLNKDINSNDLVEENISDSFKPKQNVYNQQIPIDDDNFGEFKNS